MIILKLIFLLLCFIIVIRLYGDVLLKSLSSLFSLITILAILKMIRG